MAYEQRSWAIEQPLLKALLKEAVKNQNHLVDFNAMTQKKQRNQKKKSSECLKITCRGSPRPLDPIRFQPY
ncbi:hypothetical protein PV327_000129 [Microctonus hyperodae]|uniref:Uncharacterized protein n=1 Tax=Microctonus hyperodae TaxID=165561 RepID=A0AA39G5J1_MICHY|nr:hypothetical protein PV327_000129 [Microctonus hyperodae]